MENAKKTIGVLAGGFSSEYAISIASGKTAFDAFTKAGYRTLFIELNKEGFFHEGQKVQLEDLNLSYVFNIIHGAPGEDGHVSGMLEVLGIPHSTCSTFESALTFNKAECNALLRLSGFDVPRGELFTAFPGQSYFSEWRYPVFVKPNRSGSSFGVSKVEDSQGLEAAFDHALSEDVQVLVEEGIQGTEVGCGALSSKVDFENGQTNVQLTTQAIAITEIVPTEAGFFDYEAKYEGKSQEITPARISDDVSDAIMKLTTEVYDRLSLKGIVRMDFIIENQQPVLIEVNSIPGLSPASIIPQQIAHRGWDLSKVLSTMAEEAMNA